MGEAKKTRRPRPRPRFEIARSEAPEVLVARLRSALEVDRSVRGLVVPPTRVELCLPNDERRIYSPQLTVDVRGSDEGSLVKARFGPDPHVWTLYVALYAVAVFGAFVCLAFGASQWVAGQQPWALYLTPLSLVLAGLVHGAAYVGQGLGSEQMYRVRAFLETAIEGPEENAPAAPGDTEAA